MKKIAIKYGLWMLLGFTAFFLLMHLFGQSQNYNLRVFNGVIHLSIIYLAIRDFRQQNREGINNHLSGVAMGMYASLIGVVGFTVFMILFLAFSPGFMEVIKASMPVGKYLNPVTTSMFILVEGVATSLIGSYIITRIVDMNMAKAS